MTHLSPDLLPYIEVDWYSIQAGQQFSRPHDALHHYLSKGEVQNLWPNRLFDPLFYRTQYDLDENTSCLIHFATMRAPGCLPNKYFDQDWYEWQNPDFRDRRCSVLHYLAVGGLQYRDPSPHVDMTALSRTHATLGDGCDIIYSLASGALDASALDAVTVDAAHLTKRQREFLATTQPKLLKKEDSPVHGKNLLFVQCNRDTEFWNWFSIPGHRDWDLFLNCYAKSYPQTACAEYVCEQMGTKFTAMLNCWRYHGDLLDRYEHVFFIDDDLHFRFDDISKFFQIAKREELDLAQPSLSADSHCSWKVFFNARKKGVRRVNSIEIMMPLLSRRARNLVLPYFMFSVSGFGLDLLMAKLARKHDLTAGVIDDVVARHCKTIDQSHGNYYEYLRQNRINSKYELWRLMQTFDLENSLHEV